MTETKIIIACILTIYFSNVLSTDSRKISIGVYVIIYLYNVHKRSSNFEHFLFIVEKVILAENEVHLGINTLVVYLLLSLFITKWLFTVNCK